MLSEAADINDVRVTMHISLQRPSGWAKWPLFVNTWDVSTQKLKGKKDLYSRDV
jgi:hypothetical protein